MEGVMTYAQAFFGWLIETTLIASIVICLILLIQKVLGGKLGPRWCHALWLVLLIRMILPWAPSSRVSLLNLIPSWDRQIQREQPSEINKQQEPYSAGQTSDTAEAISAPELETDVTIPEQVIPEPRATDNIQIKSQLWLISLRQVLPVLWLAGTVVIGIYLLLSNFALWQIVKRDSPLVKQAMLELFEECKAQMGVRTLVVVVPSSQIKSPALFGFIRPRLLLPREMLDTATREEMRYVFLHELAHLRRHDIYLGWLTSLLQVLHWFNPLVWFAFYRMRTDREFACDALVLARTQKEQSREYGQAIVSLVRRFSRSRPLPAMAGILESKSQLKRRIAMIAKFKKNSYRWSPLAIILIVILAFISLPDAEHTRASEAAALQPATQPKFTEVHIPSKISWDAQLSPDGTEIAFGSEDKLWIVTRAGKLRPDYAGRPRPLDTGGIPVERVGFAWSRDGRWIAFTDSRAIKEEGRKGNQRIYIVPAKGGEARQVHETNRHSRIMNYQMSLSPNGKTLAFSSFDAHEIYLETISVDGGSPKRLVDAPAREPAFSPDGRTIAYVENKKMGVEGGGLWTVPADGGTPTLVADANNASSPVWSPDGRMIAFIDLGIDSQIYIVPVAKDGTPAGAKFKVDLPEGTEEVQRLAGWTPDNKIGGVFTKKTEFALYTQPVQGGKATFLAVGGYPTQPRWFPDSKRVCHTNNIDESSGDWERYALAYVAAEGGQVTTIPIKSRDKVTIRGYGTGNRVSPDGTTIVFAGQAAQKNLNLNRLNIWTLPIGGGEPKRLTDPPTGFTDWYPCWSHDGQNIAFVRQKISDDWAALLDANIYVVSSEGGEPRKITWESDRVYSAGPVVWSPSGEWLAFYSRDRDGGDGALCLTSALSQVN